MNDVRADHAFPALGPELYAEWRTADIGVITDRLKRASLSWRVTWQVETVLDVEVRGRRPCIATLGAGCPDHWYRLEHRRKRLT
jgi:hypothetical protein